MLEKEQQTPSRISLTSCSGAGRAGGSRTPVSYASNENGKRSGNVSEETRAKVLLAAQELGYSIHISAQALRKGQSDEICVIVDLPPTVHRTELVVSFQQCAYSYGFPSVVYLSFGFSQDQVRKLLLEIFARRPMGIFATAGSMTTEHLTLAKRMGVDNIVLYSVEQLEHGRTIVLPTMAAGYLAAQHLLERGHRHLGLVHPADPLHHYGFLRRLEGMQSAIAEVQGATLDILPLQFLLSDAHTLVDTYLTRAGHPTGIYAYNDEYALLLLGELADQGRKVPGYVADEGSDGVCLRALRRAALTDIPSVSISLPPPPHATLVS